MSALTGIAAESERSAIVLYRGGGKTPFELICWPPSVIPLVAASSRPELVRSVVSEPDR